jgi:putative transposase
VRGVWIVGSTRRSFTDEYKAEAVAFVIEGGRPVAEVARNIGVHEMTLGKWVKKERDAQASSVPADVPLNESERLELVRLRDELKDANAKHAELQMQGSQKNSDLVCERKAVKFAAIADWADSDEYPVTFMCRELGVSTSGYYDRRKAEPSARAKTDAELVAIMRKLHADARGNPGVRRMRAELVAVGHRLGLKRVWRLMRLAGLRGRHPKAWKRTTIAGSRPVSAPDLIGGLFSAEAPDQKWCGDVTYVKTWDGWAYLATVIDLHSRRLLGAATGLHPDAQLTCEAIKMAVAARGGAEQIGGVIFHTDRGSTPPRSSPRCAAGSRSASRWAGSARASTPRRRRSSPAWSGRCCPGTSSTAPRRPARS